MSVAAANAAKQRQKHESEMKEAARKAEVLLRDNLWPVLSTWHQMQKAGGKKLTMQHFFKTAGLALKHHRRDVAFFGIRDNKVFQLDKVGWNVSKG